MHQEIIDANSTTIQDDYENKKIHDGPILSQIPDFFKKNKTNWCRSSVLKTY